MALKLHIEPTTIITILLLVLCTLAGLDLWRQYTIRGDNYWFEKYTYAVQSSERLWTFGFRVEDLELKIFAEQEHLSKLRSSVDTLAPKLLDIPALRGNHYDFIHSRTSTSVIENLLYNDTAIVQIHCGSEISPFLRVGVNDFRTDSRDSCQLFSSPSYEIPGPLSMFEIVPFSEGAIGLRSIANDYFVKAVPPPQDNSALPWKLVVGGPVAGAEERFRWNPEDGTLYSSTMNGYFQCSSDGIDMVKGYPYSYSSRQSRFTVKLVDLEDVMYAHELVDLSAQVIRIQHAYMKAHKSMFAETQKGIKQKELLTKFGLFLTSANAKTSPDTPSSTTTVVAPLAKPDNANAVGISNVVPITRVCLAVPMTSKGTIMDDIIGSPFWSNLFDSFMKSIDWRSNKIVYHVYLGFDMGDLIYDTGDAWNSMRNEFSQRATFRMKEQGMEENEIDAVLKSKLGLKLMHFDHLAGAPTQVVSQLILAAYVDNFDYFYQVNDDTQIVTANWAPQLIAALNNNPSIPNFGVTGPVDTNNDRIFTHSFVHRTHIEVFGHMFPTSFRNWWSDDWITTVYGVEHTFRCEDVKIKHNVDAQKEHGYTRYEVDKGAQQRLYQELVQGFVQIDSWLKKNLQPRLPLPAVCGYSSLVRHLYPSLQNEQLESSQLILHRPLLPMEEEVNNKKNIQNNEKDIEFLDILESEK